jgi:hypothetical protein
LAYAAAVLDALNSGVIAKRPEQGHCGINIVERLLFPVDGDGGHVNLPHEFLLDLIVAQIVRNKS